MSLVSSAPAFVARNSRSVAYEIEQSLRFDTNSYMSRTFGSGGNRSTWTFSVWLKICRFDQNDHDIFGGYDPASGAPRIGLIECGNGGDVANQFGLDQGGDGTGVYYSDALYRDPSAWYHLLVTTDYNNATQADRAEIFINGERVTTTSLSSIAQKDGQIGGAWQHSLGARSPIGDSSASNRWNGYMAECHYVDGTHVSDASDFGEYDRFGVWRPIEYTGSHGTVGFYLKFDPSAANGIGHDHSGNGNHWTPTGFTTTGDRTDVVTDTPTNNHCTLNPIEETEPGYESSFVFSEGNLKIAFPSSPPTDHVCGTLCSTGAWYAEVECISVTRNANVNVLEPGAMGFVGSSPGNRTNPSSGYSYSNSGSIRHGGVDYSGAASWTAGDVIGVACNVDGNSLRFYKNGVLQYTFTTTRTEPMTIGCDGTDGSGNSSSFFINCGQQPYQYTPPTGFTALSTNNLPAPTIKDGSDYFNTVLYTGDGNDGRTVTGVGFQPDFTWIKRRDGSQTHALHDVVRGPGNHLATSNTNAEVTTNSWGALSSFDSDGFTIAIGGNGTGDFVNRNTWTYASWNWLAGGTGSSNTDGTITSTVSANATAGFSIVTYTGSGTAGNGFGHGLGVAPKMVLIKGRSNADNWHVYHESTGNTGGMFINSTSAFVTSSFFWNDTSPSSTVVTLSNSSSNNSSGVTYVAYCFAEVEGYSKFGSYTGNGNVNGPFVYCGFKPAWILIKRTGGADDWFMYDTARDTYNQAFRALDANTTDAEKTTATIPIDILSNGFKIRSSGTAMNGSGETIVFAAFAENSFGGSGVTPATAR